MGFNPYLASFAFFGIITNILANQAIFYMLEVSIVIPVFNEEESLKELNENITNSFKSFKKSYEIVFIDDGSSDSSLEILQRLEKAYSNVRVFSFRKQMGKSPALTLGFQKANGEYIITMDADLQDDPKNINPLFAKLTRHNLDMVTGWRKNRQDSALKIFSSKLFNSIVSYLFKIKIHDLNSGLKIYSSDLAKSLNLYGGMHRFIPVIAHDMGFRVGEKEISHHARKYGKSKYKFSKILTDIPDLVTIYFLTKYTRRPLHFFGKFGGILFSLGSIVLLYLVYLRIMGEKIGDRPLLLLGILLVITGMQTIFTGLIADLIVNLSGKKMQEPPLRYETSH